MGEREKDPELHREEQKILERRERRNDILLLARGILLILIAAVVLFFGVRGTLRFAKEQRAARQAEREAEEAARQREANEPTTAPAKERGSLTETTTQAPETTTRSETTSQAPETTTRPETTTQTEPTTAAADKEKEEVYRRAYKYYEEGDYQNALTLFRSLEGYRDSKTYINHCATLLDYKMLSADDTIGRVAGLLEYFSRFSDNFADQIEKNYMLVTISEEEMKEKQEYWAGEAEAVVKFRDGWDHCIPDPAAEEAWAECNTLFYVMELITQEPSSWEISNVSLDNATTMRKFLESGTSDITTFAPASIARIEQLMKEAYR